MEIPILLPNIFNHPFTYKTNIKLKIGDFVEVPFGKKILLELFGMSLKKKVKKHLKLKAL
tara:strand:+ start:5161 stop:5340 length:180 start_codon:yes stop_codon:yes gene_type:complete